MAPRVLRSRGPATQQHEPSAGIARDKSAESSDEDEGGIPANFARNQSLRRSSAAVSLRAMSWLPSPSSSHDCESHQATPNETRTTTRKRPAGIEVQPSSRQKRRALDGPRDTPLGDVASPTHIKREVPDAEDDESAPTSMNFYERINRSARGADAPRSSSPEVKEELLPKRSWQQLRQDIPAHGTSQGQSMDERTNFLYNHEAAQGQDHDEAEDALEVLESPNVASQAGGQSALLQHQPQQQNDGIENQDQSDVENGGHVDGEHEVEDVDALQQNMPAAPAAQGSQPSVRLACTTSAGSQNGTRTPCGDERYQDPRLGSPELGSSPILSRRLSPTSRGRHRQARQPEPEGRWQNNAPLGVCEEKGGAFQSKPDGEDFDQSSPALPSPRASSSTGLLQQRMSSPDPDQLPVEIRHFACIEPLSETSQLVSVRVAHQALVAMLQSMSLRGWTNAGPPEAGVIWKTRFLDAEEGHGAWLESHLRRIKLEPAKALFAHSDSLRRLCREIPNVPDFDGQAAHLCYHIDTINKLLFKIMMLTENIGGDMTREPLVRASERPAWFSQGVKMLCRKNIPLLVLLLQDIFGLGGVVLGNGRPSASHGRFTSSTLNLMLRVTGWIERLLHAVLFRPDVEGPEATERAQADAAYQNAEEDGNRRQFAQYLSAFQGSLTAALWDLDRKKQAMEKDRLARLERERQARECDENRNRQMQLFLESTRRLNAQLPSLEPAAADKDEYAAVNSGWFYKEDADLLSLIRKVESPVMGQLARLVPGRSVAEVADRVSALRRHGWDTYTAKGVSPPRWCYDPLR